MVKELSFMRAWTASSSESEDGGVGRYSVLAYLNPELSVADGGGVSGALVQST